MTERIRHRSRSRKPPKGKHNYALFNESTQIPSDVIQLPTQQAEQEYKEYLAQRTITAQRDKVVINPARYLYHYKHGTLKRYGLYLSQTSYENLRTLSRRHFYSHDKGEHQRGLSLFIRTLASPDIHWTDTRPQDIRDLDPIRLTLGIPPMWLTPEDTDERKHRGIYLNDNTLTTLYRLALSRAIIKPTTATTLPKLPTIGYLLEVIGREYLTPSNIPINPKPTYGTYRKPAYKLWYERHFIKLIKQPKEDMIRDAARKEGLIPYNPQEGDYYVQE